MTKRIENGFAKRSSDWYRYSSGTDGIHAHLPNLEIRAINVVVLMAQQLQNEHPHGLADMYIDALFSTDTSIIFAYHDYPWLIHRLTYRRLCHDNLHGRGYNGEGTITTPFDMLVLNDLDRFHLVMDVLDRVPDWEPRQLISRNLYETD